MRAILSSIVLLSAGLAGAACGGPLTQPDASAGGMSADVIVKEQTHLYRVEDIAVNDCTGQQIPVVINVNERTYVRSDDADGFHVSYHLSINGFGTDPATGDSYIVKATAQDAVNVKASEEETFILSFILLGQGIVPDQRTNVSFHITVNPDGTVSSYFNRFRLVGEGCPG
jgi:hypothetical protein